jgi:hypothetical protein
MKQLNFNNQKDNLTENDIEQLISFIGYKCSQKTKLRLKSILTYGTGTIKPYGILSRLIKDGGLWSYVAGQSYDDEIRTVRNCILRG